MFTSEKVRLLWKDPVYRERVLTSRKRYVFTTAHRENLSKAAKARGFTESHKRNIGLALTGKKLSECHRKRLSDSHKANSSAVEHCKALASARVGIPLPIEHRLKISIAHKAIREKSHLWQGGIYPENEKVRKSIEYRLWREAVFARDNWTCQLCNTRGGRLHGHHIKSFSSFPELRFAIDNGMTLCEKCHKLTLNYGRKGKK